jgi:hypothetical protein
MHPGFFPAEYELTVGHKKLKKYCHSKHLNPHVARIDEQGHLLKGEATHVSPAWSVTSIWKVLDVVLCFGAGQL